MTQHLIMLIEDNEDEILLIERAFRKANTDCELVVIRDGHEAIDYLYGANNKPKPALIRISLRLPKMNGLELVSRIRGNGTTSLIPVVVFASSAEPPNIKEAYEAGVSSYVKKPIDADELADVAELLARYWLILNQPPIAKVVST
jgi:CheY-like chemotaxis protein